ncbi:MAG TPA: hypothetical protein ENG83_14865 [Nitrospirae bacterium]|nr:hypothetical protein BMS3Abin06_02801 [bacterium BMS3Abin06]HDH13451.1 hypothetical protein [Nitrospirota bacterium]HDZ01839.1 hypothetical protein [Nitrospirota bacterium]
MKIRIKKYKDLSPVDSLVLRERLGLKRYRKMAARNADKKSTLMYLALNKIEEKEKDDFIVLGYRRRKVNIV